MTVPLEIAEVFINANFVEVPPRCLAEIWNDQGGMSHYRDHRVLLVYPALPDVAARMRMDVGENPKSALPAVLPERGVTCRMKGDGSRLVGFRIEVVVADEGGHLSGQ